MMTSRSEDRPLGRPVELLQLPALLPVLRQGEDQGLEAKRAEARAWLVSRGILEVRPVYGPSPD